MSLSTNILNFATRVGTEIKSIRTLINGNVADLSALSTSNKSNLVSAINELVGTIANASGIDDSAISTTSSYSSSKVVTLLNDLRDSILGPNATAALDTLAELAEALQNNPDIITNINTALGYRLRFDAAQTLTTGQQNQARANINAASATDVGDTNTNYVQAFETGLA